MDKYRKKINQIDLELIKLLQQRNEFSELIGKYKKENNIEIFDQKREEEILKKYQVLLEDSKNKEHILAVIEKIIFESKAIQKENNEF